MTHSTALPHRRVRFGYWAIFRGTYGDGPFACFGCRDLIEDFYTGRCCSKSSPVIHHLDHDHDNNDPANLVPMHFGCHTRLHGRKSRKLDRSASVDSPGPVGRTRDRVLSVREIHYLLTERRASAFDAVNRLPR